MIADILIVIDNGKGSEPFLEAAVGFAEQQSAQVNVLMVSPGPLAVAELAPFGALYIPEKVQLREEAERLAQVRAKLASAKVPVEVKGVCDDVAWVAGDVRRASPVADLILIGGADSWGVPWVRRRVAETLLLSSGTPLLIMPDGRSPCPIRHAVLGWKPVREAVRALHDLVLLAEPGAAIDLVVVSADGEDALRTTHAAEAQRHLVRHGFQVTPHVSQPGDWASVAHMIEHHAVRRNADLVAIGGYGHSRLREVTLGGVSRELIAGARLPVLLSH